MNVITNVKEYFPPINGNTAEIRSTFTINLEPNDITGFRYLIHN